MRPDSGVRSTPQRGPEGVASQTNETPRLLAAGTPAEAPPAAGGKDAKGGAGKAKPPSAKGGAKGGAGKAEGDGPGGAAPPRPFGMLTWALPGGALDLASLGWGGVGAGHPGSGELQLGTLATSVPCNKGAEANENGGANRRGC